MKYKSFKVKISKVEIAFQLIEFTESWNCAAVVYNLSLHCEIVMVILLLENFLTAKYNISHMILHENNLLCV